MPKTVGNIVISHNISIAVYLFLYAVITCVIVWKIDIPLGLKAIIGFFCLVAVKPLSFFAVAVAGYTLLIMGYKDILPIVSKYIYGTYLTTRHNLHILERGNKACIYVTNYPIPFYNYLIATLVPEKTVVIGGKGSGMYGVSLIAKYWHGLDLNAKGNYESVCGVIRGYTSRNFNILVFVEEVHVPKNKPTLESIGRIKTGIFSIAKSLNIPVVPIYVGSIKHKRGVPTSHVQYIHAKKTHIQVEKVADTVNYTRKFFIKHARIHKQIKKETTHSLS